MANDIVVNRSNSIAKVLAEERKRGFKIQFIPQANFEKVTPCRLKKAPQTTRNAKSTSVVIRRRDYVVGDDNPKGGFVETSREIDIALPPKKKIPATTLLKPLEDQQ